MDRSPRVKHRLPMLALMVVSALLIVGLAVAAAEQPEWPTLVRISLRGSHDLDQVEATGVPVYARPVGRSGPYLIAGPTPHQIEGLRALGLEVVLLDGDTRSANYYLVSARDGQELAVAADEVQVLHADGVQALVRGAEDRALELAEQGFAVAALDLVPIELRPRFEAVVPDNVEPDPQVAQMIAQVDQATLRQYERWLTGEEPAQVGGQDYTIATRYTYSGPPIQKATQLVSEHLEGLGLEVAYHQWAGSTYPNVVATQPGLTEPEDIYIISAHLDSLPAGPTAPGADDNASGATGVLMAADILTQYEFGCTLKYALWTGEEQGMLGSQAWAKWASDQDLKIRGVLNVDMIAYDSDASPVVDLHARSWLAGSVAMAYRFADVVGTYNLDLKPEVRVDDWLGDYSDNRSFWDQGYDAILSIEDHDDFNPNYHTTGDRVSALNVPYMAEVVRASVGTLVHSSGCFLGQGTGHLEGRVTSAPGQGAATVGTPLAGATVTMADDEDGIFLAYTDSTGYYTRTLPAGTYMVTVSADGYQAATATGVVIHRGSITTEDFELEPAAGTSWRLYLPLQLRSD